MRIYFATNEKYYSRFFRYLFKEPVSHVAIGLYTEDLDVVVDCTKPHGKLYHMKHWGTKYEILYYVDIRMTDEDELSAYKTAVANAVMVPYDWGAYWYGFLAALKRFVFGTPFPTHNAWQSSEKNLCQELLTSIKPFLNKYGLDVRFLDFSGLTPHMIGRILYKRTAHDNKRISWPAGGPQ